MAKADDAAFPAVPDGEVRIETPDGVSRTYGNVVRNNLTDANYVAGGWPGYGYGAFPREEDFGLTDPYGDGGQPTMRRPVGGD